MKVSRMITDYMKYTFKARIKNRSELERSARGQPLVCMRSVRFKDKKLWVEIVKEKLI